MSSATITMSPKAMFSASVCRWSDSHTGRWDRLPADFVRNVMPGDPVGAVGLRSRVARDGQAQPAGYATPSRGDGPARAKAQNLPGCTHAAARAIRGVDD